MSTTLTPTRLLTVPEVAAILNVSRKTVGNLTRGGKLNAVRPTPDCVRYRDCDVTAYMESLGGSTSSAASAS